MFKIYSWDIKLITPTLKDGMGYSLVI